MLRLLINPNNSLQIFITQRESVSYDFMTDRPVNNHYSPGRYVPSILYFLILENSFGHSCLHLLVRFGSSAYSYTWLLIRSFLFSNRTVTEARQMSAMKSGEIVR